MSIYITKKGEKRKLNISATDVQLLDIDDNFKSKNLEDALKELSSTGRGNVPRISSSTFTPVLINAETGDPIKIEKGEPIGNYVIIGNMCFFTIKIEATLDNSCMSDLAAIKLPFNINGVYIIKIILVASDAPNTIINGKLHENRIDIISDFTNYQFGEICGVDYENNRMLLHTSGFFIIQE